MLTRSPLCTREGSTRQIAAVGFIENNGSNQISSYRSMTDQTVNAHTNLPTLMSTVLSVESPFSQPSTGLQ